MPERIKTHNPYKGTAVKLKSISRKQDQAFYDSARWKRVRAMKLKINPVCQCQDNCLQPAAEVHHIEDRKKRPDLAYDLDNLQSLTKSCHSKITKANQIKQ